MRSEAHQFEAVVTRFAVEKNEIGLDMAVAMVAPFARQRMIEIAARERPISSEQIDNFHQ